MAPRSGTATGGRRSELRILEAGAVAVGDPIVAV
jgi:hypothetical protein